MVDRGLSCGLPFARALQRLGHEGQVLDLLDGLVREQGSTLVTVTHDHDLVGRFDRVVDFLDFFIGGYHWPAFNVADSAITVGITIFIAHVVLGKMPE